MKFVYTPKITNIYNFTTYTQFGNGRFVYLQRVCNELTDICIILFN